MLKKTLIRKNILQLLKDNLLINGSTPSVFGGRIAPYDKDATYPAISVYNRTDSVEEDFSDHTLRSLELSVVVATKENSSTSLDNYDFDEIVENAQQEVEKVISRIIDAGNPLGDPFKLFEDIAYLSSTTSFNDESGDNMGFANITYTIKYRVQRPIEVTGLVDFDETGSYQNIDIIELRPLQGFTP